MKNVYKCEYMNPFDPYGDYPDDVKTYTSSRKSPRRSFSCYG